MATAEINELFEEGITRCRELSDEADEAMNAVDQMAERAEALTRRVEEEGQEACRRLRELTHDLEEAGAELESGTCQAEEALAGFDRAVEGLRGALDDLLARAEGALAELSARSEDIEGSVNAQAESVRRAFDDLGQTTSEAQSEIERQTRATIVAIVQLGGAVDEDRKETAQKLQDWAVAGQELTTAAQEAATAWTAGLAGLLDRQATALVEAGNAMVDEHNEAMKALERRFAVQAPLEVLRAVAPLVDAVGELGEEAIKGHQELTSSAREQVSWAESATSFLGEARGRMDSLAGLV